MSQSSLGFVLVTRHGQGQEASQGLSSIHALSPTWVSKVYKHKKQKLLFLLQANVFSLEDNYL